jgi:phosphoglycolate phosphatase
MTSSPAADRIRLAVFDCDGTLVDSQHAIIEAMGAAFAAESLPAPPAEAVRRVIGLPLLECAMRLAPEGEPARWERLTEAYKEAFFAQRQRPDHHEPLFDGVREALDAIEQAGWLLGIATGKAKRGLLAVLERHGLHRRFITLQCGDMGPGKPHPAMLERAMAETGATALDTVMIGDTSFDMLMARSARVHSIGVEWGYHPPDELRGAGAHALVAGFGQVPEAVFRCGRGQSCG